MPARRFLEQFAVRKFSFFMRLLAPPEPPLWGLGQRVFFLHDGRTSNLLTAIRAHQRFGSEANLVIANFNNLTEAQKQDVMNFLRSL